LGGIFNGHNGHVWAEANPHVASVHCHQQWFVVMFWQALCMTILLGLTCNHDGSVHRLTEFFWPKSYQKCWRKFLWHSRQTCGSSVMGLWLILHVRSENISPPLTTIGGLDGVGPWLGLFKSPDLTPTSYGATLMPRFTRHQLTLKRILLPVLWRWQQPGIFEGTCQSLLHCHWLCIKVGGHVLEHLL